jgi:teichoic acid transport system permease protein
VLSRQPGSTGEPTRRGPGVYAVETALLPRYLEAPEQPPSLVELASRYGLRPAAYRPRLGAYLRELWRFRQFILTYANGRIVASFGTARLGRMWQILTPLLNAGIYFLIFGVILGARAGVDNFIAYLCVGMFVFTFTQSVASTAVGSISGQLGLVRALQFPRASLPIAAVLTQVESVVASVIVLLGICLATGEPLTFDLVYLLPALLLQSLFNLGLAFGLARVGAKVSDVRQLLPYLLRTWMYCSGVLYSVSVFAVHLPAWAVHIAHANPALVYIELARYALMEDVPLASEFGELWIMGGVWAFVACTFGFLYFWRAEPEYGRG